MIDNRMISSKAIIAKVIADLELKEPDLFFTFTEDEFEHFCQYINSIDGEYYQELNKDMKNARKIFLRMPVKGFYCALYPDELKELRRLIDFSLTDDAIESALSLENYCLN